MAETTTDDTDLGDAFSALGESMDGLNSDLTSLGEAVEKLETSTRSLSHQQRTVSEEMGQTATSLLADRDDGPTARGGTASLGHAAADD